MFPTTRWAILRDVLQVLGYNRESGTHRQARFIPSVEQLEDRRCPALVVGGNTDVSRLAGNQAEETIAMNPTQPGTAFVASCAFDRVGNVGPGLFAATNAGGAGWVGRTQATLLANGSTAASLPAADSDPKAAYDSFGNLFLTYSSKYALQTSTSTAAAGQNTLIDTTARWAVNEWANMLVTVTLNNVPITRTIASNSASQLVLQQGWGNQVPPAGTAYTIILPGALTDQATVVVYSGNNGTTFTWLATLDPTSNTDHPDITTGPGAVLDSGRATGGSPISLIDATKAWPVNQWTNQILLITGGTGQGEEATIASNTATTLTISQPWTIVPDATSTYQILTSLGSVWVSWTDLINQGQGRPTLHQIFVTGAPVNGAGSIGSFIPKENINGNPDATFSSVAVGPNGQMVLGYDVVGNPTIIHTAEDTDGTFGGILLQGQPTRRAKTSSIPTTGTSQAYDIKPQMQRGITTYPILVWDRSGRFHPGSDGRLYLIYTGLGAGGPNDTEIKAAVSDNSGRTWRASRLVNDPNTLSQFLPAAAVDQTTGNVVVSWYDSRQDVADNLAQIYATITANGGTSWVRPNTQVGQWRSLAKGAGSFNYGDYTGVAFNNNLFIPAWADNSNSGAGGINPDGVFHEMDVYVASVSVVNNPGRADPDLRLGSTSNSGGVQPTLSAAAPDTAPYYTVPLFSETRLYLVSQTLAGVLQESSSAFGLELRRTGDSWWQSLLSTTRNAAIWRGAQLSDDDASAGASDGLEGLGATEKIRPVEWIALFDIAVQCKPTGQYVGSGS